jgi:uncharacterized RDD family membrane protein YckC
MECPHCRRQTGVHAEHCGSCGGYIPASQHLLEESGILGSNPEPTMPTPKRVLWELQDDGSYRTARLGDRLIAFVLDIAFLFAVFAIVDAWAFMRWGIVDGAELKLTVAALLIAGSLNAAIFFLYFWLLEALFGSTAGKVLVGIRVVQTTPRHPFAAFAIRNLLRAIDGLGFYLLGAVIAGCSKIHRRLGDICAGTVVIEGFFGYGIKIAVMVLWTSVLAGSFWSVPRICKTNAAVSSHHLNQVIVRVGRSEKSGYFWVANLHVDVGLDPGPRR